MKIAMLTTDNRWPFAQYEKELPWFGPAPEALIQGFVGMPEVELHVVSCIRRPVRSPEKLADNLWFHSLYVPKLGWMRTFYAGCLWATRRRLKLIQPDIVHGQGSESDCGICAVFSGFPNVFTLHGIMQEQARLINARPGSFYWMANRIENLTLRRTDGVFCNSQYTEDTVRSRARKVWRVPNAIRELFFQEQVIPSRPGRCILLNVGLVCPRKRQIELLEAARELHEEGLEFELLFLGQASEENPYGARFLDSVRRHRAFASHRGFKSVDEVIRHFEEGSGLVHVPSEESFGLVVAEALARNLKLFGFRVGGVQDIASGVDGAELVADGDWAGLKVNLRRWIRSGSPRLVNAAVTMRQRYHPINVARRHIEIYREVLGRSG